MRTLHASVFALAMAVGLMSGAAEATNEIIRTTLKDGTKVEIVADRMFTYQYPNHSKTAVKAPAKDGTYTLQSGKTVTVKDGKLVDWMIKPSPEKK